MRTIRLFLLPVIATTLAMAQDVESAERKFNDCVVKKDTACLTELTAPAFTMHQSMEGRPLAAVTKEQFIKFAANQALTFQSVDEMKVSTAGDAAVVTMRVRLISEGRGMTGSFLITDFWVRSEGQWKLAVRNAGRSEKVSY